MMEQVVPLQPMEDHTRADIHTAAHGGPHAGADPVPSVKMWGKKNQHISAMNEDHHRFAKASESSFMMLAVETSSFTTPDNSGTETCGRSKVIWDLLGPCCEQRGHALLLYPAHSLGPAFTFIHKPSPGHRALS
ncbi:uncharacterized protein ACIBXB_012890 [Morphnus guianensis]